MDYFKLKIGEEDTNQKNKSIWKKNLPIKIKKIHNYYFSFFLDTLELLIIKIKIKEIKLFHRQIKGLNAWNSEVQTLLKTK